VNRISIRGDDRKTRKMGKIVRAGEVNRWLCGAICWLRSRAM
jgi:hypothetical protein